MDMHEPAYWNMLIRRSLTRFYLLAALAGKAMHGYELQKAVADLCQGCCDPSDAVIYPVLRELAEGGYCVCEVQSQGGRQRKVCELTDRGRDALRVAGEAWAAVLPSLEHSIAIARGESPPAPAAKATCCEDRG